MYKRHHPQALAVKADLLTRLCAGRSVVDVGCGDPQMLGGVRHVAARAVGVLGVRRVRSAPVGGDVVRSELTRCPFRAQSFDVVYCFGQLPHALRPDELLEELTRLARPGGCVVAEASNRLSLAFMSSSWLRPGEMSGRGRVDLLTELKQAQPYALELKDVVGVQVASTPAPLHRIPVAARGVDILHRALSRSRLRFFGAGLVLVWEKRCDLIYKER